MDHAAEAHRTDLMTITCHVLNEQCKHPEARYDFTILLNHIVLGCKFVCPSVSKVILVHSFDYHIMSHYCRSAEIFFLSILFCSCGQYFFN